MIEQLSALNTFFVCVLVTRFCSLLCALKPALLGIPIEPTSIVMKVDENTE